MAPSEQGDLKTKKLKTKKTICSQALASLRQECFWKQVGFLVFRFFGFGAFVTPGLLGNSISTPCGTALAVANPEMARA